MYTNLSTMEDLKIPAPPEDGNMNISTTATNKMCRICLEEDEPEAMIAPCRCKGSSKWVHRDCLDEWRLTMPHRAFSKCTECEFEYYLQSVYREVSEGSEEGNNGGRDCGSTSSCCCKHGQRRRRWIFCALLLRDFCCATVCLQMVIAGLGGLIWAVDANGDIQQAWPAVAEHPLSMYYLLGWLCLLVLLGLYGCIALCCNGCSIQEAIPQFGFVPPPPPPPFSNLSSAVVSTKMTRISTPAKCRDGAFRGDVGMMTCGDNGRQMTTDVELQNETPNHHNYTDQTSVEYYRRARRYRQHRQRRTHHHDSYRRSNSTCSDCCLYGCYDCHPFYFSNGGANNNCCCFCCSDNRSYSGDCCNHGSNSATAGHHHDRCCCDTGDTGNNNNDCGDGAHVLLLILVVLAVILAVIGFFIGVAITIVAAQRVVQRHIHLLQKRQLVQEFQVMDLSGYGMDMPLPSSPVALQQQQQQHDIETCTMKYPLPSAPVMPEEDAVFLKKMGLIEV